MLRMSETNYKVLFCISFILVTSKSFDAVLAGSCREAQLCCNGRDSSCVVQKASINAVLEDLSDKPCYCDHACLKLGDCCDDFKNHCGVLDCGVSEWSAWSECDKSCGIGMMTRNRVVLQAPKNGGKHCPSLVEKRGCQGLLCHGKNNGKVVREVALLLPAELSKNNNSFNDSNDTRLNLGSRVLNNSNLEYEYCVEYEVIKASKSCHKLIPYNKLLEGDRVIVRCYVEAFMGGFTNRNEDDPARIKLNSNNSTSSSRGLSNSKTKENEFDPGVESDDQNMIPKLVETQPSPLTTYRCRGEGLTGRITKFSVLPAPSCRGKWLRLTVGQPIKCYQQQFVFV